MKNSYTVIIVSWNVERLLRRCLNSLQPVAKEIEVVVVDNNSIDGTLEMIKQEFP
ncbi:MAG: glycosyltransferase family 2 protein, partial [Patescibacteria group bacterium]